MKLRLALVLAVLAAFVARGAQAQHEHHHHPAPAAGSDLPTELDLVRPAGTAEGETALTLERVETMALEGNPTLEQAQAAIRVMRGRAFQAGQYPNPIIGATGDENTPDSTFRGGEIGMFGEGRIVTAGKLKLERAVFEHAGLQALAEAEAQKMRVLNSVRAHFYETLGAEWSLSIERRLAELTNEAVAVSRELVNVGQADLPDLLAIEIEAQRSEIAVTKMEIHRNRAWSELAAVIGNPSLSPSAITGDLESFPRLETDSVLLRLLSESPEIKKAEAGIARAEAALGREQVENVPDILLHGGFRYSPFIGRDGMPIGLKGFFDVGIEIPIFDRNKGAIAATKAELETARREVDRVKLSLRQRLARQYEEYEAAARLADLYRGSMLPRAQKSYEIYRENFGRMAAAYPQVLIARRNFFELQREYIESLTVAWRAAVVLEGLLLEGALDNPNGD